MTTDRKTPGYMTEDLQLREVSGPPSYKGTTDKAVEYIAIANERDVIIAYIYANDEDDVVAWLTRPDGGHEAQGAYYPWMIKLRELKARGLKPLAVLDELVRVGTDTPTNPHSHVVPTSRRHATSLPALKELAGVQPRPSEPAPRGRGR
jgi:hypothetical protein